MSEEIEETEEFAEESDMSEDEQLDLVADTAIEVLRDILSYFDCESAEINEYEGDDGELILDVVGGDLAILIGRHGRTIDALQLIVSSITNRKLGYRYPLTVDIESYKHRRKQKVVEMAQSAADRAYNQDRAVKMRPMNPYERRLVHMALKDDKRVETGSEGTEPDRYVVIKPL